MKESLLFKRMFSGCYDKNGEERIGFSLKKDGAACAPNIEVSSIFSQVIGWRGKALPRPSQWAKPSSSQKLRKGGQTVRGTIWPWGTLGRRFPSLARLSNFRANLFRYSKGEALQKVKQRLPLYQWNQMRTCSAKRKELYFHYAHIGNPDFWNDREG